MEAYENGYERPSVIERRRKKARKDWVMRSLSLFGALNFVLAVAALLLLFMSQPTSFSELDANLGLRTTWEPGLLRYLFFVMLAGLATGLIGLVVNSRRLKRSYDFVRVNPVLMAVSSSLGIIVYLFIAA